jgi:hypothetical protein
MPHHRRRHAHGYGKNVAIDPAPTLMSCSGRVRGRQEGLWCSTGPRILLPPSNARVERNVTRTGVPARHNGGRAASARRPLAPMALDAPARTPCADSLAQRHLIRQWIGRDPRRPAGTKERGPGSSSEEKLRHGHMKPRLWSGTKLGGRGISGNTRSWLLRCGALVI